MPIGASFSIFTRPVATLPIRGSKRASTVSEARPPSTSVRSISETARAETTSMNVEEILQTPSMPLASPSYPRGPFRFIDREYMIIAYESDPEAIRQAVPEPLVPVPEAIVYYEWIRMPDSSGFGDYTESGIVIPCSWRGTP